jgi:methionyl-tRNA formyltransferase
VERIAAGTAMPLEQPADDDGLRPAPKIFRDDCRIDWGSDAASIHNFVRGLSPYPAAWSMLGDHAVKVYAVRPLADAPSTAPAGSVTTDGRTCLHVACGDGRVAILDLQLSGKKRMPVDEFLRGFKLPDGSEFV